MNIIAFVSAKGGVGKTTVSANICAAMARKGRTVLAIDLDPQNALSLHFGYPPHLVGGIAQAAVSELDLNTFIQKSKLGTYNLPYGRVSEEDRQSFESILLRQPDFLVNKIRSLDLPKDSLIILDTPPGPSVYLKQALQSARLAVVVLLADAASYATLPIINTLLKQYSLSRHDFITHAYLINQLDKSKQLNNDVRRIIESQFSENQVMLINQDPSVAEALAFQQDIHEYAPDSRAAYEIDTACEKLLQLIDSKKGNIF